MITYVEREDHIMAMRKAGEARQNAQVIFMIEAEIAGRVEAWRIKRGGKIKSQQYREIFLAGLEALEPKWAEIHGAPSRQAVKKAVAAAPRGTASSLLAEAAVAAERVEVAATKRAAPHKTAKRASAKAA